MIRWPSVKPAMFGTISTAWTFQMKCLITKMFPGGVKSIKSMTAYDSSYALIH